MPGTNQVPERLIGFRVYNADHDLLGIATVDLPSFDSMTDTVSGAGIAGEVESPVMGHVGSMKLTLNWNTITKDAAKLYAQKAHELDIRGSQQLYDASTGTYVTQAVALYLRATPTSISLGSFETGATTGSTTELEVLYLKLDVGGENMVEIDKFNYIFRVAGEDTLAPVRSDLGLA